MRSGASYPEASAALALVLYQLGRPAEAEPVARQALSEDKNLWSANYAVARILIDGKRYDEALGFLDRGRDRKGLFQGEDQYRFGLALAQVGKGEMTEAEKNALLALTLNPGEASYGTLVAQIFTARNAPTLAIDAYEKALATPGVVPTPEVHCDLARLYEGEKRFNDALGHYLDAIEIDSTYAAAFKSAARLYSLGNQHERSGAFYLRYTELVPDDAEGWFGQAEAFSSLGSNRRALEAAERAYAIDSTDARIRLSLARASYMGNDIARSERLYASVADTTLYKTADWVKLAQIAMAQKGFLRAEELLARALEQDPANAEAFAAKGKLFLSRQKPDSAVVYYQKSLEVNPRSAVAKVNLGVAYLQLRRPGDAARVLREAVALNPDAAPAHIYLGQAMVMADSLSTGLAEYRRALEIDPKSAAAMRGAAFIHLKRGEYGAAESLLLRATEVDPRNADGWASLGSAQSGLRKIDEGIKSFEKALEISPNHEGALRGLDALRQARAASGGK
jgi:tetratricopeptide (TPR) repeat protein